MILGKMEEVEEKPVVKANYFASHNVWEVIADKTKSRFNGVMVREMLDSNAKSLVMSGKKVVECNGFKFKLVK